MVKSLPRCKSKDPKKYVFEHLKSFHPVLKEEISGQHFGHALLTVYGQNFCQMQN